MINWRKTAVGYAALLVAFMAAEYTMLRWVMPTGYWVEYRSVEALGRAMPGGPIRFLSSIDRYRTVDMMYNDTLFCDIESGVFEVFSFAPMAILADALPRSADDPAGWWYTAPVPKVSSRCYLRAVPRIRLRYGIERSLDAINSQPFQIGADNEQTGKTE